MVGAGAVAVSDDGKPIVSSHLMRTALEYARTFDIPIADHCEEPTLAAGGVMHEGLVAARLGLKGIPAAAEEIMVARDIVLAELTGGRVHLCHMSTRGSVDLLRRAKERGSRVTAEVTPHHLALTDHACEDYDTHAKMNPPLREAAEDRKSTRLNSSHDQISYAVLCLKKKSFPCLADFIQRFGRLHVPVGHPLPE